MKSANTNRRDLFLLVCMVLVLSVATFLHCWWFRADVITFFPLSLTVATLAVGLILWCPLRWVRWLLFTLLFVGTLFESAHMLVYDGDIASAGYLRSLFMTTPYEAGGAVGRIIRQHIYVITGIAVAYLLVTVLLLGTRHSLSWQKWVVALSSGLLLVLFAIPRQVCLPLNVYMQAKEALRQRNERNVLTSQRDAFEYGAKRSCAPEGKEVYVLIIDESLRDDHVSLNGDTYRLTMPRIGGLSSLVRYRDYYATGVFTMYAVPMIITRATPENFTLNYQEKGVQQAFAECGFKTVWLTNEAQLVSDGVSAYVAQGAEIIRVKRDMDMPAVVDSLCTVCDKLFVIMHLWGNHQYYLNTDPATSLYFPDVTTSTDVHGQEMYINSYDNAILYTDSMLLSLTDILRQKECIAQWIFTSDHGEGPIGRNGGAHGYTHPSSGEYHVPLMVWYSEEYKQAYPEKIANMVRHKDKPVCADHIFWSVLDMADVHIDSTMQQHDMSVYGDTLMLYWRVLLLPDGNTIMQCRDERK